MTDEDKCKHMKSIAHSNASRNNAHIKVYAKEQLASMENELKKKLASSSFNDIVSFNDWEEKTLEKIENNNAAESSCVGCNGFSGENKAQQ